MRRRRLALLCAIGIAAMAGCIGPFGESPVPPERLGERATYDWDVTANATYTITANGTYEAVYRVPAVEGAESARDGDPDTRTLELHRRDGLGQRRPLAIRALRYRYANGTVLNGTALAATEGEQRTTVTLPAGDGLVAYTAASPPKRFETAVFVAGSHDVILPAGRRVGNPVFGHVSPPTDDRDWTDGDRRRLRWDDVGGDRLSVRYYRQRDVALFAGVLGILLVVAGGAAAAVYRQLRQLRADHEELDGAFDGGDADRGPPPGLR